MQYLDFDEALFFSAGSGKEQEREIYLYCIAMYTLINILITFVVLFLDETEVQAWKQSHID